MKVVFFLAAAILAGLLLWGYFYPVQSVLEFDVLEEKNKVVYLKIEEGGHFRIKYTHSVHLSDVIEEYEVRNNRIYPVQLIYEDTAVGMPSNAQEGETFEMKDGKYYITGLKGYHEDITLSIGKVRAEHTLLYKENSYLLKDFLGAGSVVKIKPGRESMWNLVRGVTFNE
ncbi:DUF1850 domain-containing protein [Halobacillus massiliensis]|uniref:DUF1850 domain-containing protein n=1 Tax=Halobacillus massiliensis TaxID=1926286 RepID=UPI00117BC3EB|nr:DUF1850 domain-containing protein [Halobacillus massiliensis]